MRVFAVCGYDHDGSTVTGLLYESLNHALHMSQHYPLVHSPVHWMWAIEFGHVSLHVSCSGLVGTVWVEICCSMILGRVHRFNFSSNATLDCRCQQLL